MGTEGRISKLESVLTKKPEIAKWVALNLYNGEYSTLDNRRMTEQEYQALAQQPGVGLIIINRVDTPEPQED